MQAYAARIDEVNIQGAALRAILETNPSALQQAVDLDLERKVKGPRSVLHGIPVLVKDNIATIADEGSRVINAILAYTNGFTITRNEHNCGFFLIVKISCAE